VLYPKACPLSATCPSRPVWVKIYENTIRELRQTTFDKLSRDHKARVRFAARRPSTRK
jgi:hypothetical protein